MCLVVNGLRTTECDKSIILALVLSFDVVADKGIELSTVNPYSTVEAATMSKSSQIPD